MSTADQWIRALGLQPHPEGGVFRETYRSSEQFSSGLAPGRFTGMRAISTAIVYLLRAGECSNLHRLAADEVWHFYDGGPLLLHVFPERGEYRRLALGRDVSGGASVQVVVPHGSWFGAELAEGVSFALVGCTVAPGFEYEDFELGERRALVARYPAQRGLIEKLTREGSE